MVGREAPEKKRGGASIFFLSYLKDGIRGLEIRYVDVLASELGGGLCELGGRRSQDVCWWLRCL